MDCKRITIIILLFVLLPLGLSAQQIRGVILDAVTGDSLARVSVSYRGRHLSTISSKSGQYSITRHNGWKLTFSAVGYKPQTITVSEKTKDELTIRMHTEVHFLGEVYVKAKKEKYSRKNNPAVELMKRVIAAKNQTKLENNPYYQYRNYEKLTIALNDLSEHSVDSGLFAKKPYLKKQLEKNPVTEKWTLPIITTEKVSKYYFRKDPVDYKTVIEGEHSSGINDIIETGDMFTALAKDIFSDVDIYDNTIRLLRQHFTSPISDKAISFYRYYIVDTVKIDRDSCIAITFTPNNQQDFGFRGDMYVVKDSTLHVKRVRLQIPKRSDINFVTGMNIDQEYSQMADGQWVLTTNDMLVEMSITGKTGNFLITRTSRRSDYAFDPIEKKIFRGKATEVYDPYAQMRDHTYWQENRDVAQTHGEAEMDNFISGIKNTKHFGWAVVLIKAITENFIETTRSSNPSKIDIGPVTSLVSYNSTDGFRIKPAFMTTANLNPHIFLKGYYSHGFKSGKNYYSGTLTYSLNKKAYTPQEFPKRNIIFSSTYDIGSASDKFSQLDKDNIFVSIRWTDVQRMSMFNKQSLHFEYETDYCLGFNVGMDFEKKTAIGNLYYTHIGEEKEMYPDYWNHGSFRTSEISLQLTYSPGQHYMNTKLNRFPLNHEAPEFKLKHTMGIQGFMGGNYNYNVTEASVYKRLWVHNCGRVDVYLKGGIQWNRVPFPLLIAPAANLSIIKQPSTFNLVTDMEFLNDRFVSLMAEWDLQGKIFNRIPLLKRLKWREHIGFNLLWGTLTDKNNPTLAQNQGDAYLMQMPAGTTIMDPNRPYGEIRVGIHNILRFFRIDYVRRLNYNDNTTAPADAIRLGFGLSF